MSEFWLRNLSHTLSDSGLIAYTWHPGEDRFEWAGNLQEVLGLQSEDHPRTNAQFHKILNPQYAPSRLAEIHEIMKSTDQEGSVSFALSYKVQRTNGAHIDIEESATLHYDHASGTKILCGFLKVKNKDQLSNPMPTESMATISPSPSFGTAHSGRQDLCHKIEEWADHIFSEDGLVNESDCYLLVAGVDRLSLMNEAFGARYVDELITLTGKRLERVVGDSGTVARIDGDVFGVFFGNAAHTEMTAVAKYILNNFYDAPLQTSKGPMGMSLSIGGISIARESCNDTPSLITKAEMAMQAAKDKGRSCFVSYSEAAGQAAENRLLLEAGDEFLKALKGGRVRLAFQAIMNASDSQVSFHECLIRMLNEDGKVVAAGDFVPAVEKLGLSRLVDQFALRSAIQELSAFPDLKLSVNVSNLTLNNQDWLRGLVMALRDRPSVAKRLTVEITESAMMNDINHTMRVIQTVKGLGCRVALDDFGAGYTGFSQLKDLDLDIVKIDKSFVRNMDEDKNHLFVRTLQSLADGVNAETVGEGAETTSDVNRLIEDGITYIQGFVYGFPRVERIWLPKNHVHRSISLEIAQTENATEMEQEEIAEEIIVNAGLKA